MAARTMRRILVNAACPWQSPPRRRPRECFVGETASAVNVSVDTITGDDWQFAKLWLLRELAGSDKR
jgi:hypothetical protein